MNLHVSFASFVRCVFGTAVLAAVLLAASPAQATGGVITTIAGGTGGDGGAATSAVLYASGGVAAGGTGDFYIADYGNCRVRKVSGGTITTVAGDGVCAYSGDGGAPTSASLYNPRSIAVTGGDLYIVSYGDCRVRRVSGGTITTVAGNGSCGYGGDGGAAASASLSSPGGVAVDGAGDLYIADTNNCLVRKVSGGMITRVAGAFPSCGYAGDGGVATSAELNYPLGVAVDGGGDLYIADYSNCRIRKVSSGTITTAAGGASCGFSGDGGAATSAIVSYPSGVAVDGAGDLYIATTYDCRVREVSGGIITTVAGIGECGSDGDGSAATSARLAPNTRSGVAVDGAGNLYMAESCRIREVSGGTIATVAGTGSCGYGGDGGPATSASLKLPAGVAVDTSGNVYIADTRNCLVRKVTGGTIATFAGTGSCGSGGGFGGAPTSTDLGRPTGLALDSVGDLYIADSNNCRIEKVSGGTITTVAGNVTRQCGYSGDGGSALGASLGYPNAVALDSSGTLYIADTNNCRIRKVTGGTITTVAGNGLCFYTGDGGAATSAGLGDPFGVAVDGGDLYLTDRSCRVRKVSGGTITTVAGNGFCGYSGDGGDATSASLGDPTAVVVVSDGNLYITDQLNCRIRKVSGGVITTVAGSGTCGFNGDGGAATNARLASPAGIALDGAGNLYVADTGDNRIREVTAATSAILGGVDEEPNLDALPSRASPDATDHRVQYTLGGGVIAVMLVGGVGAGWVLRRRRRAI